MIIAGFIILCGFGVFGTLCSTAPVWDDELEAPVRVIDALAERA